MKKTKTKKKAAKKEEKMLSKKEWLAKFFGKVKSFGDGLEYQKMIRGQYQINYTNLNIDRV